MLSWSGVMMQQSSFFALCFFFSFFLLCQAAHQLDDEAKNTYIVHMDHSLKPERFRNHEEWHRSELSSLSNPVLDTDFLYSYSHVMHGFSARLTSSQLLEVQTSPSHLISYQESYGRLLTTHSPTFLGLNHRSGLWPAASRGKGVIIGVLDTGIWPESKSFSDKGMPPVPQRFKGKCQNDTAMPFSCNNKLIGAQVFIKGAQAAQRYDPDLDSPRDFQKHGTHTASTAAGNYVEGAGQFGFARGTARGVAPRAHLAIYKVDTTSGFGVESDVLAAMDQALSDGIDVLSLSLGFNSVPYFNDAIAKGSLSAIEKGVVVVCAAGNGGHNSIVNGAPWILNVGAGSLDRATFAATVTLGNGLTFEGDSMFLLDVYISNAPLYYGIDNVKKSRCLHGALNEKETAGKVVLCRNHISIEEQLAELQRVRPDAAIFIAEKDLISMPDPGFPYLVLPMASEAQVTEYATSMVNATVRSMRFTLSTFGAKPAPKVAGYSSRGPYPISPGILKPDVIAPGSVILAAVPPFSYVERLGNYALVSDYLTDSGTSMAAPHVAGVAALLKKTHPKWSPAAIRSAMMTTAYILDNQGSVITDDITGLPATPLDYGAGHIDPNKAMDPGLVYDIGFEDYVEFSCSLGYNEKQMRALLRRRHWNCSQSSMDLNYPSFVADFRNESSSKRIHRFSRVLTNVDGRGVSTYQVAVVNATGMTIRVEPDTLTFSHKDQKHRFVLTLEINRDVLPVSHGRISWIDQYNHTVSSPVVALSL